MKKFVLILIFLALLFGCDYKESMEKHNKAQSIADNIIENLEDASIYGKFPEKYFPSKQLSPLINYLTKDCDWKNRDGKFVDFVTIGSIGKVDQTGFIYEYYLDCDSLRFILMFNMELDNPELRGFVVEPLEKENKLIVDPSKQLKNRK
jgi:hypothetical protein